MGFIFTPGLDYKVARNMSAQLLAARPPAEALAKVEDRLIPGPASEIPIRIYTPEGSGPFPGSGLLTHRRRHNW
jgi:hypothetical protein